MTNVLHGANIPKKITSRKQIEMGESSFEIKMGGLDDFRETYLVYSVLK